MYKTHKNLNFSEALSINEVIEKVEDGYRISKNEAKLLYTMDVTFLGILATKIRKKKTNPKYASYIIDRNINYSNICAATCKFCAFFRRYKDEDSYVLKNEVIETKIIETKKLGGNSILMQGGLHPKLRLDYYQELLSFIKQKTSPIHIHAFSPPEIVYLAKLEKKSIYDIILSLKKAGLDSIPGGGAEILVDSIRKKITKGKCMSQEWLNVMETAHNLNLNTTATMMFGHIETLDDRLEHLEKIRNLQDKTNGFTAFIPWTYQKGPTTPLEHMNIYAIDYLKTIALSRIFLDNFKNIQGSWLTQGYSIGLMTLFFGANDLGSIMIEENVVRSAGTNFQITEKKIRSLIETAGYIPFKRDTLYKNIMPSYSKIIK